MPSHREAGTVRAVTRALEVLGCFSTQQKELSVSEIGRQLGLSRPTLYRLLATLERAGFVRGEGEPLRFRLGAAVGTLAQAWSGSLDLQQVAAPVLAELRRETGETVCLMVPHGTQRLCVAELPGPNMLTVIRGLGSTEPMERTTSGKVMLAHMKGARRTSREYAQIRRLGYAVGRGRVHPGVLAIAAPVLNRREELVGAVTVLGAEVRFDARHEREVVQQVSAAAGRISALLGRAEPA